MKKHANMESMQVDTGPTSLAALLGKSAKILLGNSAKILLGKTAKILLGKVTRAPLDQLFLPLCL